VTIHTAPARKIIIGPIGAGAAQLAVEVYYPESRSPQYGVLSSIRQGFPFTVSAAYGFAGWLAYRTAGPDKAALNGVQHADEEGDGI
jgi:hypothetical protein